MNLLGAIATIAAGFFFLVKGADYLVSGASSLARKFGISSILVGLTVVAFGTSMPELTVTLVSVLAGNTDIAIGNIIGSNIANIALILGLAAVIRPLDVERATVWKEIPRALLAASLMFVMANDVFFDGRGANAIGRIDGLVLLLLFAQFLHYVFNVAKNGRPHVLPDREDAGIPAQAERLRRPLVIAAYIVGGIVALVLGGKLAVDGAVRLATMFGLSSRIIGLTVIAVGTSLPELVTSVIAAVRRESDIAVGNVVGSNIFNVLLILGLSAAIRPLPFPSPAIVDAAFAIALTMLFFLFMFLGKRHVLERWQGIVFLCLYVAYTGYLLSN